MGQTTSFEFADYSQCQCAPPEGHNPLLQEAVDRLSSKPPLLLVQGYEGGPPKPSGRENGYAIAEWAHVPRGLLNELDALAYDSATPSPLPKVPADQVQDRLNKAVDYVARNPSGFVERLSPEKRQQVNDILQAIVHSDVNQLTDLVHKGASDPKGMEDVMYRVVQDLARVNIDAIWTYNADRSTEAQPGPPQPGKDVGVFTMAKNLGSQVIGIQFYTEGEVRAAHTNMTGNPEPADSAIVLSQLRDQWLRRM